MNQLLAVTPSISDLGSKRINIWSVFYLVLSSICLSAIYILYLTTPDCREISLLSTILCGCFLLKFRKSVPFIILFLYMGLYFYESTKFFYDGIAVAIFKDFNDAFYLNKILFHNSLFIFVLGNVITIKASRQKFELDHFALKSKYIYAILFIVCLIIIQFGIRGESLLAGARYGSAQKSTLHEYFILFYFLLILVKPRNSKIYTYLNLALYGIYALKTLLYGGRIEVVQVTLLIAFLFWIIPGKLNKTLFVFLLVVATYINMVVENARNSPITVLKGDYEAIFTPSFLKEKKDKLLYLGTNQGDVLYASCRMTGFVDEGIIPTTIRIKSFIYFMSSVVVSSSMVPSYASLSAYKQSEYGAGGGGLVGSFFYVWFGIAGPILIALFLGYFFNRGFLSKKIGYKIYAVILLVMVPRWFAYTPLIIFKYCFLAVVVYFLFEWIFKLFFKSVRPAVG